MIKAGHSFVVTKDIGGMDGGKYVEYVCTDCSATALFLVFPKKSIICDDKESIQISNCVRGTG